MVFTYFTMNIVQLMKNIFKFDKNKYLIINNTFHADVSYNLHHERDCLPESTIHHLPLTTAAEFEICKKWCTDNCKCGGFTVYRNVAYFKRLSCKFGLVYKKYTFTFIKQTD